jgi:predicted CXXCH cytochrome family protein
MKKSIIIIVLGAIFLLAHSVQAITRRADKECLLCHVLWFDAFKTDQKTLIERSDSSIVIAGSMGLASSAAMCVTCHDGYVVDSRVRVAEGNPHHALKKVPESLKLLEIFRLDRNNEIYCGTCHTLHDFKESAEVGSTPFMRFDNERSQMCIACHGGKTEQQGFTNHPVLKEAKDIPHLEAVKKGSRFGPAREIICQSCHNAHGKQAMVSPVNNSSLCTNCHVNKNSLINGKHDLRLTLPDLKNIKQQRPSQSGPCGVCHIPHNAAGRKLWAKRLNPENPAAQMCLICHAEQSVVKTKRIGQHSHPTGVKLVSTESVPSELPLFSADATRDPGGRVQCFTCHNAHQWDPASPTNSGGKNVEGDASNSFLRISNGISSDLCAKCHADKKQVIDSDHNLSVTAPQEKNTQGFTAAISGPCGACHIPHNAAGMRLWAKPLSGDTNWSTQLCTGCHHKAGAAQTKLIGDNDHPVDVALKKLNISESSDRMVPKLPLYGDDGKIRPAGKMVCLTCHDPHTWSAQQSRPDQNHTIQNREGDATSSFLRSANYPASDLCRTCHPTQAGIDGTDHDLKTTAPQATNLLGQTVKMSGACGACHLVHNGPGKFKLWARSYSPLSENENIMNALCTSCHSKGNMAEKKVPPIATHPTGKLISNIIRYNKKNAGYTPIFDKNGQETHVGEISCPSCHNAHQWSPLLQESAVSQTQKDNGMDKFRFLRNMSKDIVCINCHGRQALYRYLYFHSPDKRKKMVFVPAHKTSRRQSIF